MICPFHDDRNPSSGFYLDTEKFFCFSCELSLDLVGFYAKLKEITRSQAARDLDLDPDPVIKYNKSVADTTRLRAERELAQRKVIGRRMHASFAERMDNILWMYMNNKFTDDTFHAAMARWYKDLEETCESNTKLGPVKERSTGDRTDGGVKESTGNLPQSGLKSPGSDLEGVQSPITYSIPDVLE